MKPHYSLSKVQQFNKCRYSYFLKYIRRLEPKEKPLPLNKGSIIHEVLEKFYTRPSDEKCKNAILSVLNISWAKRSFDHWEDEKAQALYNLCYKLINQYYLKYAHSDEFNIESIEKLYQYETSEFVIDWKPDMLFTDNSNTYWLMETKTGNPDLETLVLFDPQGAFYTYLCRKHLGLDCCGVLYNLIPDNREIEREWVDYTDIECKNTWNDICTTIEDMKPYYCINYNDRNRHFGCKWCEYSMLCYMEIQGMDTTNYLKENFKNEKVDINY